MTYNILIAPSGFKESLSANAATDCIAKGIVAAMPDAKIFRAPMADGGEGFVEALVNATSGTMHRLKVTGPVGEPVDSFFGFMGGQKVKTAVIEMAAAAGLSLVPRDRRDPTLTTSTGVGELISAALDHGAERILMGCGDSGINDGGMGMARALGAKFLNATGTEIVDGGGALTALHHIDISCMDRRLKSVVIDAAVNHHNMLLGDRGVARVFAPQKGATPAQVEILDAGLQNYARCILEATGKNVGAKAGAGASGGLGAGLFALLGAELHPRFEIVLQYLQFDKLLASADLVFTAEGSLDEQTPYGKVPAEVGRRAKDLGIPVVAIAGTLGKGVEANLAEGIGAYMSILQRPCPLEEAIADAERLLCQAAESTMRMMAIGIALNQRNLALKAA